MELKINEKFRSVAPPLSENEIRLLREDILANGCRDPLIVWDGVIVDGHHRYKVCRENNIPFLVMEMEFKDENEALVWIAKNQLGRRNLNSFQRCELVLPLESALTVEAEKRRRESIRHYRKSGEIFGPSKKTRDILSEMAGVSHALLSQVKTILDEADEDTKEKLRRGEIRIRTAYMRIIAAKSPALEQKRSEEVIVQIPSEKLIVLESRKEKTGAEDIIRELLRKVTYGEADPETVIMELTKALKIMEGTHGKTSV